ncbi:MAG: molybdopterin-dependent oxidoreductase [Deltaproteobacteria bacterium]|jgi:formate dehydrogenase major subunit|nr:molybdopterin-dependent oxidoreductase [Deltaproteobacteria bacterium]
MSEVTRRSFLKISAAAVSGGVALESRHGCTSTPAQHDNAHIDAEIDSCCQFCQVRCSTKLQVKDGRVVNVTGNPENFWTAGSMCPKGKSLVETHYRQDRLLYPLRRTARGWERISYEKALRIVVNKIQGVKQNYPRDFAHRVALFMPLWDSRESELAALMALQMAGFPDACSPGDACIGSSATMLNLCLGSPNSTTTLDEALEAETFVLWGANIAEMYPPYMRWVSMAKQKGARILFLDPRETPTRLFSDVHLRPRPGTDGALALGAAHFLIDHEMVDAAYVKEKVTGFEALKEAAEIYTPDYTAEITGLSTQEIQSFARTLGKSSRTLVWLGGSLSRYTNSMQTIQNIIALQAITNNLVGPGKGIMNVQGGKPGGDHEFLKHYQAPKLSHRLGIRKVLYNMKKGNLDVLLLNSSYRRYPDADDVRARIRNVGFVVYRGFFMDEEAELADLIIPGAMPFECEGSQYGAQRQVVWRRKALPKPGETSEDWRFYTDLGRSLNGENFPEFTSAEEIYEVFRKKVKSWHGLTLEKVKASPTGITWPYPKGYIHERRGSLFVDGNFLTGNGKVNLDFKPLGPIRWDEPKGSPRDKDNKKAKEYPLIFMQGKVVQHWQQSFTNWSEYMGRLSRGNFVQLHPDTAIPLGIEDGDLVTIESIVGSIRAVAHVSKAVLPGIIFTPSHPAPANKIKGNSGGTINTIVPSYWSNVSAQFNGFGCRLVKA